MTSERGSYWTDQELCKLIAERVMGWTVTKSNVAVLWCYENGNPLMPLDKFDPLHDGGQALEVKEKLHLADKYDPVVKQWVVMGKRDVAMGNYKFHATNPDLKRAICLCAARCVASLERDES